MDNNQEEHLDKRAGMDFKAKMKLFQSKDKEKQAQEPSQKETTKTPKSQHSKPKSEASVVKAYSPCKEEENTNRTLPSPEPSTGNAEQTSKTLRIASSPESAMGTDEKTAATKELKISSSPELLKGAEGETATTHVSRFQQTKFDEELQAQVKEISSKKGHGWNPKDLEVFNHPMCLISAESIENEDGEEEKIMLKSEEEVFEQIKQIDLPLVVVAVVGLYRTGKSYLMNCLAESSKGGFALGNTIQSKTKGIWVWCKMHPTQKNTVLVLLDTEGLGDVEKGDQNHDNNLFTLATLLCNCLVYNMKGAFDNEALSKLTFVTEMAENIRYRGQSSKDNQALNLILPDFVLCVRDFTLELKFDGKVISANEYLETSLASKKGKAAKFNKQRECIRKYFPKRECFAFPMPGDTSVIRNLENLTFDDLCGSFREATITFVSFIYDIPPKKMPPSKPINGEMFVTLAERYVTAIKHGAVPDVDDAFKAAAKIENDKIEKQAVEIFENQMAKVALPVPGNVLMRLYSKAQHTALEYLRQNAAHDLKIECENHAQRKMDEFWNAIKEGNDKKVQEMCDKTLQDNSYRSGIEEKIGNKDYETAGGYQKFQRDVERLREDYISVLRDFEENEILWTWHGFIKRIKESEARIVEADEHLSKLEKEEERRRNQENIERLLEEQRKTQQEALDKQKKDLEDHHKKLQEDREKQLKADQAKFEELAKERLEKEAAKQEIKRYQDEQTERKNKWFGARLWNAFMNYE